MEINWRYEIKQFNIGDRCYTPDFLISPRNNPKKFWAEVKPAEFSSEEFQRCVSIVNITRGPFIMLSGSPGFRGYDVVGFVRDSDKPEVWGDKVALTYGEFHWGEPDSPKEYGGEYIDAIIKCQEKTFEMEDYKRCMAITKNGNRCNHIRSRPSVQFCDVHFGKIWRDIARTERSENISRREWRIAFVPIKTIFGESTYIISRSLLEKKTLVHLGISGCTLINKTSRTSMSNEELINSFFGSSVV